MDIAIKRASFGQDDQSWLGSAHGTTAAQSITLDVSTFSKAKHFPGGFLKSGLPLAKSGAKHVLWTAGANLAGFLFTPVQAPADSSTPVGGALLEHGRVIAAKLPVSVDADGQATAAGRIIFA